MMRSSRTYFLIISSRRTSHILSSSLVTDCVPSMRVLTVLSNTCNRHRLHTEYISKIYRTSSLATRGHRFGLMLLSFWKISYNVFPLRLKTFFTVDHVTCFQEFCYYYCVIFASYLEHPLLPLFWSTRWNEASLLLAVDHPSINLLLALNDAYHGHQHSGVTANCHHCPLQYHPQLFCQIVR